jgi:hypothetical protein
MNEYILFYMLKTQTISHPCSIYLPADATINLWKYEIESWEAIFQLRG